MSKVPGPQAGGASLVFVLRPVGVPGTPGQGARPAYLSLAVQSDLPIGLTRRVPRPFRWDAALGCQGCQG
jgi:hypothetical protein